MNKWFLSCRLINRCIFDFQIDTEMDVMEKCAELAVKEDPDK